MARIDFGHTWWGKRWLDALSDIDFENRLPRGKRYARNGSVVSIDPEGARVQARVRGTRPKPYSVTIDLWSFTESEKEKIVSLVKANPYYLAQLESRVLPPELEEDLNAAGIRLFPESWKSLSMKCSCPDWAVPCKHLAAVVYIIANEIDKNPFLVFGLHDFDLIGAIDGHSAHEDREIVDIESLLAGDEQEYNYYREHLEGIDLSTVPDLLAATDQVLTPAPLFYPRKDFKTLLTSGYKRLARTVSRHIKELDLAEEPPKSLFTSFRFSIHKGKHYGTGSLKRGSSELRFDSEDMGPLVEYLHALSAGDLSVYPPVISYLVMVHGFVLRLLERRAAIPDIASLGQNSYIVRWIPALFSGEVRDIFDALVEALPSEMVRYGGTPLPHREQVFFLISFFILHYMRAFEPVKDAGEDPVTALFFAGTSFSPKRFEEREIPTTIRLWLGRFFVRPEHWVPVIHIDEMADPEEGGRLAPEQGVAKQDTDAQGTDAGNPQLTFDIRVGDTRTESEQTIPFSRFLEYGESETLPLLRDLSLLGTYLPTVNAFLRESGADGRSSKAGEAAEADEGAETGETAEARETAPSTSGITVNADRFVEEWFQALSVFRTLGIRMVVPKALREVFQPQLTLRIDRPKDNTDRVQSYTSIQDMLDFEWRVAVGDTFMDPGELSELKSRYGRFLRYRGRYLELDEKQLASVARYMEKDPTPSPMRLLQTGLTGELDGAPVEMDDATRKLFDELFTPEDVSVPPNLAAKLRPYQERGYRWLCHNHKLGLGSIVADDMGLGKTLQVIAFALELKNRGVLGAKRPALVVVPASLVTNWQREITRFAPDLNAEAFHGSDREVPAAADIVLTTYALARGDERLRGRQRWSVLVLDEAQNIKNSGSATAKAIRGIKADYRIAMTGTPVENRLLEYWSIIDFVMPGYLGSRTGFKSAFAVPIERYRNREALEHFRTLTSPLILRRLKTDPSIIDDLPEKIVSNRFPRLTPEQAALYSELVEHAEEWIERTDGDIERAGAVFKLMTGLKQICCHPALYTKQHSQGPHTSGKARMLLELLEAIGERDEKALIFTQYAQMGELLQEILEEHLESPVLFLHGGTSRAKRDEMVDAFQNEPDYRTMVLSIKAGGVGLNLTAANHVIHYDLWWNPAVEHQATDRAFRIGQRKDVTVYRLITSGTFEEKINEMIESKEELANLTVGQGEQWITRLDTGELKELIRLQENAI